MTDSRTPLVVLLHGLFGRPADFDETVRRLPERFPVRAPELPVGRPGAESVDQVVGWLEDELAGESRALVLVGNSLGGHLALSFALRNPERVRGLVLAGSSGLFERGFEAGVPHRPSREWVRARVEEVFHGRAFASEAIVDDVVATLRDRRRALAVVRLARDTKRDHLASVLPRVRVPALLLWGTEDRITPPEIAYRFRDLLPSARLLFVPEAGHAPMIERPSVFAFHLASFLNDLSPLLRPSRRLLEEAA
ncbi:MAG: alpha/beta fold hydrolase [Thermoanaerobaculia bacterium]|jgi:pimeloyl-ACP methyl ester carboxylesterase|nr:alpha/beta fold hydrolase [Thermoanaerobaculia bacterium]